MGVEVHVRATWVMSLSGGARPECRVARAVAEKHGRKRQQQAWSGGGKRNPTRRTDYAVLWGERAGRTKVRKYIQEPAGRDVDKRRSAAGRL